MHPFRHRAESLRILGQQCQRLESLQLPICNSNVLRKMLVHTRSLVSFHVAGGADAKTVEALSRCPALLSVSLAGWCSTCRKRSHRWCAPTHTSSCYASSWVAALVAIHRADRGSP